MTAIGFIFSSEHDWARPPCINYISIPIMPRCDWDIKLSIY